MTLKTPSGEETIEVDGEHASGLSAHTIGSRLEVDSPVLHQQDSMQAGDRIVLGNNAYISLIAYRVAMNSLCRHGGACDSKARPSGLLVVSSCH